MSDGHDDPGREGRTTPPDAPLAAIEESATSAPAEVRDDWTRYLTATAGALWQRPGASARNRSLVTVAAVAALGAPTELRTQVRLARRHGLTRLELCELMVHVGGYAGLALAREGMLALGDVFDTEDPSPEPAPAPAPDWPDDRRQRAHAVQVARHGTDWADRVIDALPLCDPDEPFTPDDLQWQAWIIETAFGDLWPRPNLTLADRARVTIAVLVVGGRPVELKAHISGGFTVGIPHTEMVELIMQLTPYVGFPAVVEAVKATAALVADQRGTTST